jgi:hypothetical protein
LKIDLNPDFSVGTLVGNVLAVDYVEKCGNPKER